MNWFDRYLLAPIAPRLALRRAFAMRGVKAFYEAAEPTRYRKTRNDRRSANAQNERAGTAIRSSARHLDENFDIASGVLDVLVANTVGSGIQPEPQVMLTDGSPAVDVNRKLLKLFEDWRFRPEVTWQHDYYSLQRLGARSWFRDGEYFKQRITGTVAGLDHGTTVPYSLEALEADFVPHDMNDSARRIVQGVELSAWGRARAFHTYKSHPGDTFVTLTDTKRIPAEAMIHMAFRKRFHQVRGVSVFAAALNRLDDIKETDEFERIACKVAASMAAAIVKGNPDSYEAPTEMGADGRPIPREMGFEAGIIFDDLVPGERIETIDTKRPNNNLIAFRDAQLRSAAAGVGASYSSISRNYNGSFSSQRQELVESFMFYQMLAGPIVYGDCQPTWDGFVDASLMSGAIELPTNVDRSTIYDCTHTGPAMPWIDPEKEVNAQILAMKWGFKARTRIIRERGESPDQVNREILRDQEELQELGIKLIGDSATASTETATDDDERSETLEKAVALLERLRNHKSSTKSRRPTRHA